eukprot:CAMPEP_0115034576 /NCGR_PEP_ID=MMETSP0216-20121206/40747_1 /TAXON_ID=223996 /ORGANISM="Protocruzia adherens, Strain Boccale" /LENGTH=1399 /DNA_ID=CAMNT_0002413515 /DNA_START=36 /DNA_END=4235 /DNA_ORIENTATION=-
MPKFDQQKEIFNLDDDFHGSGPVIFAWQPDYNFLATCGVNRIVHVLDRQGKKVSEMMLQNPGPCVELDWDKDGETLGILQEGLPHVTVWNIHSKHYTEIEVSSGRDRATFIKWARTHSVLAIGTEKGAIVFYNKKTQRKIPVVGKHSKKVITGDWNNEGHLVTGGEDKMLSVSNTVGDAIVQTTNVKTELRQLRWAKQKTDDRGNAQNTVSTILENKKVLMFDVSNPLQPLELSFQLKYGRIVSYAWYGDGYMIIGFSEGWVAVISTHIDEISGELHSNKAFNSSLDTLCCCDVLTKVAVAGEKTIKFYSTSTWQEFRADRIDLPRESGRVTRMAWTSDGQILSVATTNGSVYGFLMVVPNLNASFGNYCAMLTSLSEVSIIDTMKNNEVVQRINLDIEPGMLALGEYHLSVAMNTVVYHYRWKDENGTANYEGGQTVSKRDYFGTVKALSLNSYWTAVMTDNKCLLHPIEATGSDQERRFPQNDGDKGVANCMLTENFLIILDVVGRIKFYYLAEMTMVGEHKLDIQIMKMFPNLPGTRIVLTDIKGSGFLFNPVDESLITLENFPGSLEQVLWDNQDPNVFAVVDTTTVIAYLYQFNSLHGPRVKPIRELLSIEDLEQDPVPIITTLEHGLKPIILSNGYLVCQSSVDTNVGGQYLASHSYLTQWKGETDAKEGHYRYFLQNLALNRFTQCFFVADKCESAEIFDTLAKQALENLEVEIAVRSYQLAKNVGMVMAIQAFKHETEKMILMGYVAAILHHHDMAQDFFLKSSKPMLALEMRCDLQDWLIALKLAKNISQDREPYICKQLAIQIETQGSHVEALKMFEKALIEGPNAGMTKAEIKSHNTQCSAGIARTSIKKGDVARGFAQAMKLTESALIIECAQVCESMKQWDEAAELFEKGGWTEKAFSIYIKRDKTDKIGDISRITSPKLLKELAKAKMKQRRYKDAEEAFIRAGAWEDVIDLNLNHLENPEKAKEILRTKAQTQSSAELLANYSKNKSAFKEAIEFYIMAGKTEEAFLLAQSNDEMETYSHFIIERDDKNLEEHLKIAQFYEGKDEWGKSAKHYDKHGNFNKALKLYMKAGDQYIENAIDMVGRAKNDNLTHLLVDYLMGDIDGVAKEPHYTFKLYIALGNLKQAAKIAVTIAAQEQELGNYKYAHDILFDVQKLLSAKEMHIPFDLQQRFALIHSYVIVKRLVKMGSHELAARLLNRICKNISQFPAHTVPILTSTVIECTRANMKGSAYRWSCMLFKPENRGNIEEKFKKKIERIVKKPVKEDEIEEAKSPCPYCQTHIPETELYCVHCNNNLPFCLASGKHMILDDWSKCDESGFPAIYYEYKKVLENSPTCPMCENETLPTNIRKVVDPQAELQRLKPGKSTQEEGAGDEEEDQEDDPFNN